MVPEDEHFEAEDLCVEGVLGCEGLLIWFVYGAVVNGGRDLTCFHL